VRGGALHRLGHLGPPAGGRPEQIREGDAIATGEERLQRLWVSLDEPPERLVLPLD
jgi:hypothetical protein